MGRSLDPKCKQCRREGTKMFLKGERCSSSKCALVKRNYVPGTHGPKLGRGSRLTGFGQQLREKQKAKRTYRLLETQFVNYFDKAKNQAGDTGDNFLKLLEMRLDNTVYRAGFVGSRNLSRQLISHGHFLVNGKKVTIPSFQVKVKDKITLKPKTLKTEAFATLSERLKGKEFVDWLAVDAKEVTATVIDKPSLAKNQPGFDVKIITEFYSR